jgi:type IV pilus assembly protein PilX
MRHTAFRRREQGFILVTGLLFLVVMTLVGLALFRSTGLLDRLTTNTRDKQRSFEAAEAAVEYGVWWLQQPGGGTVASCASNSGATVTSAPTSFWVCKEALSTSLSTVAVVDGSSSWTNQAFSYNPPNMTVASGGGMSSSNAIDINYYKAPGLYLESLGLSADAKTQYYQITAYGYGGDSNTVTVVRGTFKQSSGSKNRGTP